MSTTEPVERLELTTRDVVRAHESIRDTFAGHRLHIRGSQQSFRYRQVTARAGSLTVDSLHHTMGVREDVDPIDDVWITLVTGGHFRLAHAGGDFRGNIGDVLLFPQAVPFTAEWQVMDLRFVRVPTREVTRRAVARTDMDAADFRFSSMSAVSPAAARYCARTVGYLHSLFSDDGQAVAEPLVQAAALDTAAAAVLATFPHNATADRLAGPAAGAVPAAVRRALEHIDAHAGEPLTLRDIAEASGLSTRALQEAFRRHRGTSPTACLRDARLERAHRELQAADPTRGATVAGIAARWGFAHRGRFAAAYRQAYGRSPLQTLLS